jgi:hypothetical protein
MGSRAWSIPALAAMAFRLDAKDGLGECARIAPAVIPAQVGMKKLQMRLE